MCRSRRAYRVISIVILSFYVWTFGGLSSIAHAAKDALNQVQIKEKSQKKEQSPEERFEKLTQEIEAILADPKTDLVTKKQELKKQKGIIEALNSEIRKGFAETEKKLIKAKLPEEILNRHYRFVKHYEDNLNELKANLASFEKAKDRKVAAEEIEKTRAHLKKTKPAKKYQPLDPDNLPHRNRKPIKKEPRIEKESFERDFGKDQASSTQKSILVASAGSLSGLLASNTLAAGDLPTLDDLAETIEVKFTPDITAKAEELGHNPVKIYNWVKNNIEFVPTYGSIQGAQMTLETKQGNAFDTASLLIALLRVSGIHARYAIGTVEISMEKFMNWAGGFTDPYAALDFFASGGIPIKGLTSGSKIVKAQIEHVWVEAYIDYIPSRGARHKVGDTWISLDPSFKQYNYTEGMDIQAAVPFNAETFIEQLTASATINEAEGYATGIDSLLIQDTLQDYQTQVENYISQDHPDATVGDVLGKKEIITQEFSYLLGTLPYRTAVKGGSYASLPDTLRHKITFEVAKNSFDDIPLCITKSLPELAGKKITLSYSPATPEDEAVINSYLPEPHPDGTPIQPEELPDSLPAYLINIRPELRIDGAVAATGTAVGLGTTETFTMQFYDPACSESPIINNIDAGSYLAIGLNLGRIAKDQVDALKTKLEATKAKLEAEDYTTDLTKEDLLGDLFYTTALMYHAELDVVNFIAAKTMGVGANTLPSEAIFSSQLKVDTFFGIPRSVSAGGLAMDADRLLNVVKALDGNHNKAVQFMLNSGMNSSAMEHGVPEQLFSTPDEPAQGISAVKALKIANDQGIPIYTISQSNMATVLPQLQIDPLAKTDIENAVNAGKVVTVSKKNILFNGWNGCGYIIIDPATGAGAYMISGGLAGAWIVLGLIAGTLSLFGGLLITATLALAAPLCCALIGAGLVGLSIGLVLIMVFSDDTLHSEIEPLFQEVLMASLSSFVLLPSPITLAVALAAIYTLMLRSLYQQYKQYSSYDYQERKLYCLRCPEATFVEA